MPLAASEANKLTREALQRGVIETVIERGARRLLAQLPFKSFEGETYSFNQEGSIGTSTSAYDPYNSGSIPSGVGSNTRYNVSSGLLIRNADTAEIDIIGKSDVEDQQADDVLKQAKKLAQDFRREFFNGRNSSSTGNHLQGLEDWFATYQSSFGEQEVYHTSDDTATGTQENLSLNAIHDLLSRQKGEDFDVLYTNRATMVYLRGLLDAAGGNTGAMLELENFGKAVFTFNGVPVIVSDDVGVSRSFSDADIDGGGNAGSSEIVVNSADFLGFHTKDVGQTVTYNSTEYDITAVNGSHTVTISQSPGANTAQSGSVGSQNVMYAVRYDESDGVTAIYNENRGAPANAGQWNGPIVGFDAKNWGLLDDAPRLRVRLDWYGNFVVHNPYSIARLSHYKNGNA